MNIEIFMFIFVRFANLGATGKDIPKEILECFSQSLENKKSLCQNSGFRQIIQGFSLLEYKWDDIPDRIRNILPELSKSLKNNCTADVRKKTEFISDVSFVMFFL